MQGRHLLVVALLVLCAGGARAQAPDSFATIMIPPALEDTRISVTVAPGLTRTNALPTEALRQARRDMLAGEEIPDDLLRALAERGDGAAAQAYVRRQIAADAAISDSDMAWFATIAVSTGRVWTLPDAVGAMLRLDPATEPTERTRAYIAMLYPHAWAGNALALDAVIDLNGEGRLFGALSDATLQQILRAAEAAGDGRAYLRLALQLLQDSAASETDKELARGYLARAAEGDHLAVRAMARTLLDGLDPSTAQAGPVTVGAQRDTASAAALDPGTESDSEMATLQ